MPAGLPIERIWIDDDGARVEGWYVVGRGRSNESPGPAVIFAHGNGESIDDCFAPMFRYTRFGVSLLLPEYRGYGRSTGNPSQSAVAADMERFYDWLARRPEVDPQRIILHGRSLGGGVVGVLVGSRPAAAVILESTFTSLVSLWKGRLLPAFLCRNPFRTDLAMSNYNGPVLIFHGKWDRTIPVSHGRRLHKLIPHSEYVEVRAGHNDLLADEPDAYYYWQTITKFLRDHKLIR